MQRSVCRHREVSFNDQKGIAYNPYHSVSNEKLCLHIILETGPLHHIKLSVTFYQIKSMLCFSRCYKHLVDKIIS